MIHPSDANSDSVIYVQYLRETLIEVKTNDTELISLVMIAEKESPECCAPGESSVHHPGARHSGA
jgi:hypothetical protein